VQDVTSALSACCVGHKSLLSNYIFAKCQFVKLWGSLKFPFLFFLHSYYGTISFPIILPCAQCYGSCVFYKSKVQYFWISSALNYVLFIVALPCFSMPPTTPCSQITHILFQIHGVAGKCWLSLIPYIFSLQFEIFFVINQTCAPFYKQFLLPDF
jgi:hypothetical protein